MTLIKWTNSYSVDVQEIDEQHKRLVQMINDLNDAMVNRSTTKALNKIVVRMAEYTVSHFATEEKYMVQFNYPFYEIHKKEHQEFINKVTDLRARLENGTLVLSLEVLNFLTSWLTEHIQGSDKVFGPFFNANGIK